LHTDAAFGGHFEALFERFFVGSTWQEEQGVRAVDVSLVAQYWVVAILLTLTPGADWALAITAGLRARSVVPPILGILFGYAIVITVVAVGVGSLVTRYPVALTVLTFAGACYLLWLGTTTLTRPVEHVTASDQPGGASPARQFLRGAGVSGTNPKGLLLLLALLPQFISPHGWPSAAQMLALGGIHLLDCAAVYFTVALLARRILRSRPRATVIVTRLSGTAMTLIGAALLIERVLELR
jgi:threonine/homoserine/homoserine lactone efflux protein